MEIAYVKQMETIYSRNSTSFPENADRHSIFFHGKNIEHPFFWEKMEKSPGNALGALWQGRTFFISLRSPDVVPVKDGGESDQGTTKNDLLGGLEPWNFIFSPFFP